MEDNTLIRTTKTIYPQIYAYILPSEKEREGWIKIGYTERKNVDERIREQTKTAAINLEYLKLWSEPAKFNNSEEWFKDKTFHSYLRTYKKIEQRPNTEWFFYNGNPEKSHNDFEDFLNHKYDQIEEKSTYKLRPEQNEAVIKTAQYIFENPGGEFLWNAKPRFGKTLTTYDLARKINAEKVLIVTNRPAIANSWFDDFEKFIAWQTNFAFISISDSLKDRPVMNREEYKKYLYNDGEKDRILSFISLQDLKGSIYFGGNHDKLDWVKDLDWDLLVIDESHEGVDTFKTDIAFEKIKRNFTLHLSGTPFKAMASGKFSENQIFNWTYENEQESKINWDDIHVNNPYEDMPKLNMFSYQMSEMITDEVNQGAKIEGKNIDYAFDLNEFFETNDVGRFIHEEDIIKWLDSLTQNEKYPFSTKKLRDELKHTFWLLDRVASAKAMEKLLKSHPVFENYKIILAAGNGRVDEDDQTVNYKSLDKVKKAISENDKTITLSVGQLTTGVTIPEWTAVMMLSNIKSPSLYMQAAFRAQNPWEYKLNNNVYKKENAYVFDFAPDRTLVIYDEFANNLSNKTSSGRGTTSDRKDNIQKLLNFFPVIAEDREGKMVELDVNQVLTIPKAIKAQEVVKRGFMSNLLFQNVSGIFASPEAREILEQLNPADSGKSTSRNTTNPIDTQDVKLDENGDVEVSNEIVINKSKAHFGEKVYDNIQNTVDEIIDQTDPNISSIIANTFKDNIQDVVEEIAKENGLTKKMGEQVVDKNSKLIAREIEVVKKNTSIRQNEVKADFERKVSESNNDESVIEEAKKIYEQQKKEINDNFKAEISETVKNKTKDLVEQSTKTILEKAEEKKKNTVEDDVRARLRGFARTIPSFLMAYGTPTTTLSTFDKSLSGNVFKEVTGITLEQFKILRDSYNFFDSVVFDESIKEFLDKRKDLANYFDETQKEDIFDYIPPQKTNQIYTPKSVVKMMVDKLHEENPEDFSNPNKIFVDLYMKSGLYITEIVKRLYVGLEELIPNDDERLKHILENQIYGFAPTEIIYNIAKNYIFGFDEKANKINDSHIVCLDTIPYAYGENDFIIKCSELFGGNNVKFDVVVGNPPYQKTNRQSNRDEAVYPYFYDLAEKIANKYILISPARFLFNIGSTSKKWNEKMLTDKHIKVVYYNQNSQQVFHNTDIKGGITVLYRNSTKIVGPIETFSNYKELNSILAKVSSDKFESFSSLVYTNSSYKLTNEVYETFPDLIERVSKAEKNSVGSNVFTRFPELFYDSKVNNDYIGIYGRENNQRITKYIESKFIKAPDNLFSFKVIVPGANGTGELGESLSNPIVCEPGIGHNQTFISIGNFKNRFDAEACLKYIKTKFVRTMLGVKKVTQNNKTKETWSKIPLQDFTENSTIDWTKSIVEIDKMLYDMYKLSQDEINFIENKVKSME
ncbi:Eco57I restriction-modification methylase domain-containing protein [Mammaliicoccus sp. P-M59]|uniref:Eco57I restriction-modification methylase domain-containing protein n=1 Tax=Mammaliicoccus sp. P-M59 TaxID=2898718 RepID=UPI001EFB6020|nr:Eco57I restriction-modification methylase domain-containing protein [Mammaliicoccus sp. P-M59]